MHWMFLKTQMAVGLKLVQSILLEQQWEEKVSMKKY